MGRQKSYKRKVYNQDLSEYQIKEIDLDPWQKKVLKVRGDLSIRAGRQVGKSYIVSRGAANFALENANVNVLVLAAAQRQSSYLFEKIRGELESIEISIFAEKPTLTKMILKNGSIIYSLPAGRTGHLIRGLTIDLLIVDEAAFIPELVWVAIIPMIAISKKMRKFGWVWLLSTPFGDTGFFYESFEDEDFTKFHIKSEECPRISKKFIEKQRKRLSKRDFMQEWEGEFVSSAGKVFSAELLKASTIDYEFNKLNVNKKHQHFLGVDFARFGGDENAFVGTGYNRKIGLLKVTVLKKHTKETLTKTKNRIINLHERYSFNRIITDEGGFGAGATDDLIDKLPTVVMGVNNQHSSKMKLKRKGRLIKEDLYSFCLNLLENNLDKLSPRLILPNDPDLLRSLESVEFKENEETGHLKIYGNYTHLAEALVRACWGIKERYLKLYCAY